MGMSKEEVVKMQIKRVEKELRDLPHHKGTDHHIGRLRAKLAILKEKIDTPAQKGGGGGGYSVKKQGDATIILIGPPSAGKSTLINKLSNAQSKVAPYTFTTLTVIPGMMEYNNARLQILDVPGLIEGAGGGKGRGKEVLSVARNSDLVIFMTDPKRLDFFKKLVKELELVGIRVNKTKPQVLINKKLSGGLIIHSNIKQDLDKLIIKEVAEEFGIKNAEITLNQKLTINELIDSFSGNRVYIPAIYVVNKSDTLRQKDNKNLDPRILRISAEKEIGLDKLKTKIWDKLKFVTIYLKDEPEVVKNNLILKEVAQNIGEEFSKNVKSVKISGTGSKFQNQEVSLNTKVQEGMRIKFF